MNAFDALLVKQPISPMKEMVAYEAMWTKFGTFKRIADQFRENPGAVPSELIAGLDVNEIQTWIQNKIEEAKIDNFGMRIHGSQNYPICLRDALNPVEFLYFSGNWDLIDSPKRIAVVGTRNPSDDGVRRTRKLTKLLVKNNYTVISGLANSVNCIALGKFGSQLKNFGVEILSDPFRPLTSKDYRLTSNNFIHGIKNNHFNKVSELIEYF